jgi:hypothetical protein
MDVDGACVDEPATYAIGTGAECMEGLAYLRLVLGMTRNSPLFVSSMGELALDSIAARIGLHEGTAEFGLVEVLAHVILTDRAEHVLVVDYRPWVFVGGSADELLCFDEVLLDGFDGGWRRGRGVFWAVIL